jgi:hypothetical protein
LVKGSDGKLSWVKPNTDTITGLGTELNTLKTNLETNYYTKTQTETKIAEAAHLKRKKISSLEEIVLDAVDADSYIYMLPSKLEGQDNKYDEYIVIITETKDDNGATILLKEIEKVGTWEVDLSEYAKVEELEKKVDKIEGYVLISQKDLDRLADVKPFAEPNFIKVVNNKEFTVTSAGELNIEVIPQTKIEGLTEHLAAIDSKLTNVFTDALKEKLEAINLNDIENMKTSVGSLKDTIYGYKDEETGKDIPGLSSLVATMSTQIAGLE